MSMEKINYDKLQDGLEYIRKVCEDAQEEGGCEVCPLGNNKGECQLVVCPMQWQTRNPETDVFRVLA